MTAAAGPGIAATVTGRRTLIRSLALFAAPLLLAGAAFLVPAQVSEPTAGPFGLPQSIAYLPWVFAFASTGALIAGSHAGNLIGWLFLSVAALSAMSSLTGSYATYGLFNAPGTVPAAHFAAWLYHWTQVAGIALLGTFVPLLFPTGRPPRGWGWAARVVGIGVAAAVLVRAFGPDTIYLSDPDAYVLPNPYALPLAAELAPQVDLALLIVPLLVALSTASLLRRFALSTGVERLQIKWFAYAAGISAVGLFMMVVLGFWNEGSLLFFIGSLALPAAAAAAIFRYRLYDIDLLINRTLVYGAVSALLAATYFGAVVLIQSLLRPFTTGSELAVAASTLLVVALFQPLRRRVQDVVDRRFYRSRYDAARTLDAFGTRLRNEVELDAVRADLIGVVHETVQPTHARLWLRQGETAVRNAPRTVRA